MILVYSPTLRRNVDLTRADRADLAAWRRMGLC